MLSMARIGGLDRAIMATVLIAFAAGACGASAGAPAGPAGAPGAAATAAAAAPNGGGDQAGNGNGKGADAVAQVGQPGLLIIKTGTLAIQVDAIDPKVADATHQVVVLGGYVAGSEQFGDGESQQASITFRIPAARWEDALAGLRGLATKILKEHTSSQDVTGQVVDLGARIKNLQATEAAVQAIMERATDIDDVLTVQAELTRIRGEIEQLAAQKSGLEGQAAFSTLTVTFSLKPEPLVVAADSFDAGTEVNAASASLVGMLQALATAGIWFGIVWLPVLITIGLLVALSIWVVRRFQPAAAAGAPPASAPTAEA
jgi:uncharacterized protein DUF4349